ncbi:MAG: PD40 domain-containing protein [Verrucomicrobia bacterium]|nr:PD40 domain-containing protein [Verrucomicrobiota bacterium]
MAFSISICFSGYLEAEPLGSKSPPLWLRYPAISPDGKTIAFSFEGHLFIVASAGGSAQPLTAGPAHDTAPVWSPDGKLIAFASDRYGHYNVFLTGIEGGSAQRLTSYSTDEIPAGFTTDGKYVVFSAHRMPSAKSSQVPMGALLPACVPTASLPELYKVSIEEGQEPKMILTTAALNAQFDRAGERLLYEDDKSYENLWRKHNTTPLAHDIWLFDARSERHTKLTSYACENRNPVWAADENSVFYLSEQSGSFNVWKLPIAPTDNSGAQQITHFRNNPIRFLSIARNGDLCFGYDGEIYLLPHGSTEPSKVNIQIAVAANIPTKQQLHLNDGVTEIALSPNGKEIGFVVRGDVYVVSIEHGDTKRITNTPGQERNISFSSDGRKLIFAAEYDKAWSLYEAAIVQPKEKEPYFFNSTIIEVHPILENGQENMLPKYSPDGKEVAYVENRAAIKVLNLQSKETRLVLSGERNYSYSDDDLWFDWSPDGRWLLSPFLQMGRWSHEVGIVNSNGNQSITNLTNSGYQNLQPLWAQGGKSMIWLSEKYGLHGDDGNEGNPQYDVYETFFTQEALNRFRLSPAEYELLKANEERAEKEKDEYSKKEGSGTAAKAEDEKQPAKIEPITVDINRIENRTVRLTLASSQIVYAALSKDGEQLVYLARSDKGFEIWLLRPRTKELKRLGEVEVTPKEFGELPQQLFLDEDAKNAFVLVDGHFYKVDLASTKVEPVKFDAEKELDSAAERQYLFEHIWRQVKDKFYVTDLHGVDWNYYKTVYARFLPFITDNRDFAEMTSEMLGELNASHTGCYQWAITSGDQTASLGAFFDQGYGGPGIKIEEIIEEGPLSQADPLLQAGMIIEKIDGNPITLDMDVCGLLNFKADKLTALSIFDPAKNNRFIVTVKPIGLQGLEELLYKRWVEERRGLVDKLSNGTIGYVHVGRMVDASYREMLAESLGRQVAKKALIVDTRWNSGGYMHDELATFLNGKEYIQYIPRGQVLGSEPMRKWYRKTVLLINEGNYSDGLIFPWTYKHFHLGKVIGMPAADSGSFVWWETLQDPSLFFGIPEVGLQVEPGRFLETAQVDPDIRVMNDPASTAEGRDPQLERAVAELLKEN